MSSILRALKRVEDESPRDVVLHSTTDRIDPKEAIKKRAKSAWNTYRFLPYLIFAAIVFLGLWVTFIQGSFWSKEHSPPPASNRPLERENTSVSKVTPKKPIQQMPSPAPLKKRIPKSDGPGIPENALSMGARPTSRTLKRLEKTVEYSGEKKAQVGSGITPKTSPLPEPPPLRQDIDLSQFKLEAIIWSNKPESRFAVINGRIVRVGDAFEGMSLLRISKNHVELKSGDGMGKLGFRE